MHYLRIGGAIESLVAVQEYGEVKTDDISRWIPSTMTDITEAIAIYDQTNQFGLWFCTNKVLAFDKTAYTINPNISPWSIWDSQHSNGFTALFMRVPGGSAYHVYWGDSSGNIFALDGTGAGDAATYPIKCYRKTRLITDLPTWDKNVEGRIVYRRQGACTLQMDFDWAETYDVKTCSIDLKGPIITSGTNFWGSVTSPSYWNDGSYWSQGGVTSYKVSTAGFSAIGKSIGFFLTTTINSTVNFLINKIVIQ